MSTKNDSLKRYEDKGTARLPKRQILVCLRNRCTKCDLQIGLAPVSCPFQILHIFCDECGIREMRRQSGKTTKSVAIANELAELGYPVMLVTFNLKWVARIRSQYGLSRKVELETISYMEMARGKAPSV